MQASIDRAMKGEGGEGGESAREHTSVATGESTRATSCRLMQTCLAFT